MIFTAIRKLAKWILADELLNAYSKGWCDGVNQQLHEPESAAHGHISENEYWGYDQ